MTKSELKTGMIVTLRRGDKYLVLKDIVSYYTRNEEHKDCIVDIDYNSWNGLEYYNEDLTHRGYNGENSSSAEDIMMVELIDHPYDIRKTEMQDLHLLWKREEVKEVTMAEVEEKFGCKVKIIKE